MLMLLAAAAAVPTCTGRELALSTDARAGDFNGMSHSGTYLVVRNVGRRTCSVPGLPAVSFRSPHDRTLPAARRAPVGMHPGPVVVPVVLAPRGRVATGLRWVSGPVYEHSRCLDATSASVVIGGRRLTVPLRAHMCGEAGQPIGFDQPVLARLP